VDGLAKVVLQVGADNLVRLVKLDGVDLVDGAGGRDGLVGLELVDGQDKPDGKVQKDKVDGADKLDGVDILG
jgi:hypothetical protein